MHRVGGSNHSPPATTPVIAARSPFDRLGVGQFYCTALVRQPVY